jgi:mxaA protein
MNFSNPDYLIKTLLKVASLLWLWGAMPTLAADDPRYAVQIHNPDHDVGYIVGDMLTRTIHLNARAPYTLTAAAMPVKGLNRHGIELREVSVTKDAAPDGTSYDVQLTYQVFTSASFAKKVLLPQESLKLTGEGKSVEVLIPSWGFSVSPLSARGEIVEDDMSPYRGPMLLDKTSRQQMFWGFLVLIAATLPGLLYFNGNRAWLPGMGGPFARSYRKLRRLPDNTTSIQQAVATIHQAFNQTFGANLFHTDVPGFVQKYPRFAPLSGDIEEFFRMSNAALFGIGGAPGSGAATNKTLRNFCKQCRDCEREPFAMKPLAAITVCGVALTIVMVMLMMQGIKVLPIWPAVIAWACFFHLGGGTEPRAAITTILLSTTFGVFLGWLSAIAILTNPVAALIPDMLWGPLVIGVAVGILSLSAYWKPLSVTPVCVYGYAANWGYLDVPGRLDMHVLTSLDINNVMLALPCAVILGCVFGYVNAKLVGLLIAK